METYLFQTLFKQRLFVKLNENAGLMDELVKMEYVAMVESLDEQKISYSKIFQLKILILFRRFMLFEQLKLKSNKLMSRFISDPLSESSLEFLKRKVYDRKKFSESELYKYVHGSKDDLSKFGELSVQKRYANLLNYD
jgi:hypothetical protein